MGDDSTQGGSGGGLIGLLMLVGGLYLLMRNVIVGGGMSFGYSFYSGWGMDLTSGYALIPLLAGIGLIFYGRTVLGGLVTLASAAALLFGIIASLRISLRYMDLFDLLVILTLIAGGLGLLLRNYAGYRRASTGAGDFRKQVDAEVQARLAEAGADPQLRLKMLRDRERARE
jgi:hypothetical protein